MFNTNQVVTQLPLQIIWTDNENLNVTRERYLNKQSIKKLLNKTPVEFVVADIGSKLKWIAEDKSYDFWKTEVQEHLVDNSEKIYVGNFPGNYAYIASQWTSEGQPIILLEKIH